MLTGESRFHISTPWGLNLGPSWREANGWPTGLVELRMNSVRLQALRRVPPSSRLCHLWSRKEDLQRAWNRDRTAVWDQVGLSHCRHDGLVAVQDEARLRRGNNDQSRWGHQCSEATLTEESRFHTSTPLGLNQGPSWQEAFGWPTGPVELCMNAVRLQALHNFPKSIPSSHTPPTGSSHTTESTVNAHQCVWASSMSLTFCPILTGCRGITLTLTPLCILCRAIWALINRFLDAVFLWLLFR